MAATHDPLCDQKHTPRQACNRALSADDAEPFILSAPPRRTLPAEPARDPTPGAVRAAGAGPDVAVQPALASPEALEHDAPDPVSMPAPSLWATRAWEDTAAAVGAAVPTPAPGPASARPSTGRFARHLSLVGGLAALSLGLLVLLRRR